VTVAQAREALVRRARVIEELLKARLEVDVPGMVAGVRARLQARLSLEAVPIEADLADKQGPLGWGRVATTVWQAPQYRKIALSAISLRPVIEGFALVMLPVASRAAPVFGCDLMALPTRVSVNAELYGSHDSDSREALASLSESFARLGSGPGPTWARSLASGEGLHAKLSPRAVEDGFGALTSAMAKYCDLVDGAGGNGSTDLQQRQFFDLFHAHGPRKGPLSHLFGSAWAERYSRLIFE
jgi:hypothetical protein